MKLSIKISLLTLIFLVLGGTAQAKFDHSHNTWNELLNKHVTTTGPASTINYMGVMKENEKLKAYLKTLSAVSNEEYGKWQEKNQLAFLINAYNAFTVRLILDNYPIKSIKKIGGLFSSPWGKKFFKLLDEERDLDWVEHGKIRVDFKEPRIHFAVNCASIGCPALLDEAFTGKKMESQLEQSLTNFLSDTSRNKYDSKKSRLYLSKIFDWYSADFIKKSGSVEKYVAQYVTKNKAEQSKIKGKRVDVDYLDYDWTLNETIETTEAKKSDPPKPVEKKK